MAVLRFALYLVQHQLLRARRSAPYARVRLSLACYASALPLLCCAFCRDATAALLAVANGPSAATMWHRQLRVSRGEIELTLDGNVDDDTVA